MATATAALLHVELHHCNQETITIGTRNVVGTFRFMHRKGL
jgi:hypothetical protein